MLNRRAENRKFVYTNNINGYKNRTTYLYTTFFSNSIFLQFYLLLKNLKQKQITHEYKVLYVNKKEKMLRPTFVDVA